MKVFISADMEGISGVTDWEDTIPGKRTYEYSRRLLTQDVNAAIEGALEAGATEIVVNESHGPMRNLIPDELHPKAELIRGFYKPLLMMQGLDETFDAIFFIGFHGKAGENDSILNHTFLGSCIQRLLLNGEEASESDFNAAVASSFNVPVTLLTGDLQICEDAKKKIPGIHTVAVKKGIGAFAAQSLHPTVAQEKIRASAKLAVESAKSIQPLKKEQSYTIDIEFKHTNMATVVSYMPTIELLDGRTIRYVTDDLIEGSKVLMAILLLAIQGSNSITL
ncbi:M55 family metallopeptidase [Neobacillus sp. CF12]|uniref:M55 family metallopeptidase n=1 Tax=Neobacillus sp. CF12 TaxID=3055864 RepID=UPI0025A1EF9E|nr:M55 family metallopeptidase [Neobacillus sp. CF12]MDM5327014.1 M55 family metallopeptidase [Neobacillus sp. CF12]